MKPFRSIISSSDTLMLTTTALFKTLDQVFRGIARKDMLTIWQRMMAHVFLLGFPLIMTVPWAIADALNQTESLVSTINTL